MPRKPESELTGDKRKLLIISAKLFSALKEYTARPRMSIEHKAYWVEKLSEEKVRLFSLCNNMGVC
jgi:hypothetical protein